MPKLGPNDGSRRQITALEPMRFSASPRPTVVVVLPSPAGVGLMPVTSTSAPSGRLSTESMKLVLIFALWRPYGSSASSGIFSFAAISAIGRSLVSRAISRSLFIVLDSSAYLAHHGVRPIDGVGTDLGRPITDLGSLQPSGAFHHIGGIHLVQREIAGHACLVGLLQHIART